ncbi:hypothetical protein RR46_01908 [Papilio xuthus]|uniref:Uncharacterized protein n=1 Tax=Papilio xuthus TaxID=66420 RepID=A0A194QFW6_PAPXU|nr:hypothetical protein RR46_01908 [Papilio xuthus]
MHKRSVVCLERTRHKYMPERGEVSRCQTFEPATRVGRRFAMQNMVHMLSNIVLNYKVVPTPLGPPHTDIPIEKKGLFLFPGENLYVQFVPRDV